MLGSLDIDTPPQKYRWLCRWSFQFEAEEVPLRDFAREYEGTVAIPPTSTPEKTPAIWDLAYNGMAAELVEKLIYPIAQALAGRNR